MELGIGVLILYLDGFWKMERRNKMISGATDCGGLSAPRIVGNYAARGISTLASPTMLRGRGN